MTFKSLFEKTGQEIDTNDKELVSEEKLGLFTNKMQEIMDVLKTKYSPEDYEAILKGKYKILEVYKKAIPKGTLLSNIGPETSESEFS